MKGAGAGPPFSPRFATLPWFQFYGHNSNLKLHTIELFLLGCTFYIIEYVELPFKNDTKNWKIIIRKHGGDIEQAKQRILMQRQQQQFQVVPRVWPQQCII